MTDYTAQAKAFTEREISEADDALGAAGDAINFIGIGDYESAAAMLHKAAEKVMRAESLSMRAGQTRLMAHESTRRRR